MLARINWQPSRHELRYFANTLIIASVVACIILVIWGNTAFGMVVGVTGSLLGLACHSVAIIGRWVYLVWMGLTFVLSLIVSPIAIGIIYYFVLTPMALLARLFGKDELRRKRHKEGPSCFSNADNDTSPESFRRQF